MLVDAIMQAVYYSLPSADALALPGIFIWVAVALWFWGTEGSVIFVNENENENGEKRENSKFVNENEKMMITKTRK